MDNPTTVGVMIEQIIQHGHERIIVHPMLREEGKNHPINVSMDDLSLHDLELRISISDMYVHRPEVVYQGVYSIDLARARKMSDILAKIAKAMQREQAYEAGDMYAVFCKAIGAKWAVVKRDPNQRGTWLSDFEWMWLSVADGRNRYRDLVQKAQDELDPAKQERMAA